MSESIWNDPRITAYVLGELPDDERIEFERQLESDGELAAAVDEARSVTGQLEHLYASEPTAALDADRRDAIVAGESKEVSPATAEGRSWLAPSLVLATAAALLLLVGIAPWLREQQREKTLSQLDQPQSIDKSITLEQEGKLRAIKDQPVDESLIELAESVQSGPEDQAAGAKNGADAVMSASQPSQPALARDATASRSLRSNNATENLTMPSRNQPEELKRVSDLEAESDDTSSLSLGKADTEAMPESGIVLRGSRRDLDRVKGLLQVEEAKEMEEEVRAQVRNLGEEAAKNEAAQPGEKKPVFYYREVAPAPATPMAAAATSAPEPAGPAPVRRTRTANVEFEKLQDAQQQVQFGVNRGGEAAIRGRVIGGAALGDTEFGLAIDEGRGPGIAGDRFEPITDNAFKRVSEHPLSTFSVDVDTASYSKTRDFLMRANQLPRPDAVRIEELLNYFDYEYDPPSDGDKHPFAARATVTACPWNTDHRLARIALKGKTMEKDERPPCNLVFLLDTSGSMNAPNKLPLVVEGMQMLLKQLRKEDKVAITVYAGSAGLVLDSTSAKKQKKIRNALTQLNAGGSTNGGAGIALAYQTARDNFISEGVNRVILCTDGDFNVGMTGTDALVRMVEQEAKGGIFLSVLGFGMGNHNDAMLEKISGRGNGNYAFIDSQLEAHKVLVNQTSGTLVTIAKDVKLQIEFNPQQVSAYRLIGYENRVLAKEDFNDDKKDAGEVGAGHAVTALYEIVPVGVEADASQPKVDDLKYQSQLKPTDAADSDEMMTLKLRYKEPDGDTSTLVEFPVSDEGGEFKDADHDVRFAASVASFGMQLRRSPYAGTWTMSDVLKVADDSKGEDMDGLRAEFVQLVRKASELMGQQ